MMPEIGSKHHTTHEIGGNDELSLTGISPGAHKTSHQDAGSDEISVLGLSGLLGDSQTPLAHKTSHQDGGTDEISVAGLAGQLVFVPYSGKIADITHANTNTYTLNLATALSETRQIVMAILSALRITGTGAFYSYPNSGVNHSYANLNWNILPIAIASGSQEYKYSLSVANDDFDLYCFGYVVVGV